jgi:hypothetical protein
MKLLSIVALLLMGSMAWGQPGKNKPSGKSPSSPPASSNKKPEASASASFKPADMTKLAVIIAVGKDNPSMMISRNVSDHHRLVEDTFLECLLAKGYALAARSDVDSVLREKKFQESGATEELATSIGKILNVPAVMLVRVTDFTTEQRQRDASSVHVSLGARLVNVETGAILWTGNHSASSSSPGRAGASGVLLSTVAALVEAFPDKQGSKPRLVNPKSFPKLAVITVNKSHDSQRPGRIGPGREPQQSDHDRQVEDVFVQVLIQKGYQLVSRSDLQDVMKEQAFQKSGLTDDNAVAVGKLLKVPAVLLLGITEAPNDSSSGGLGGGFGSSKPAGSNTRASIGARLIDVGSGEVRWTHGEFKSRTITAKGEASELLSEVARDLAQFLPPEPDAPRDLLERAVHLEALGQSTAARSEYKLLAERFADTTEGKKAASRLK